MSEVAAIVNSPGRAGVSREMRDAGAVGMSRAQGFLWSSPREEHLRVGPHQGDGDFAPRIELATDDGPGRLAVTIFFDDVCRGCHTPHAGARARAAAAGCGREQYCFFVLLTTPTVHSVSHSRCLVRIRVGVIRGRAAPGARRRAEAQHGHAASHRHRPHARAARAPRTGTSQGQGASLHMLATSLQALASRLQASRRSRAPFAPSRAQAAARLPAAVWG
jgi:hypothetical protein